MVKNRIKGNIQTAIIVSSVEGSEGIGQPLSPTYSIEGNVPYFTFPIIIDESIGHELVAAQDSRSQGARYLCLLFPQDLNHFFLHIYEVHDYLLPRGVLYGYGKYHIYGYIFVKL